MKGSSLSLYRFLYGILTVAARFFFLETSFCSRRKERARASGVCFFVGATRFEIFWSKKGECVGNASCFRRCGALAAALAGAEVSSPAASRNEALSST